MNKEATSRDDLVARIFYTVDFQAKGFPVRFISAGKIGHFNGPFADPGEACSEFEICHQSGATRYLEPAVFDMQAAGLPDFLDLAEQPHKEEVSLPLLDVIDDRPTFEYACQVCDNRTVWNADDLQTAMEAENFAPCGCPWSKQKYAGSGEACSVIALLVHEEREEDEPAPERCTGRQPVCMIGLLIQAEASRLYSSYLESLIRHLPPAVVSIREQCWKYAGDCYDSHIEECPSKASL